MFVKRRTLMNKIPPLTQSQTPIETQSKINEEEVALITVKEEENEDWLKSEDEDVVKVSVPWEPLETSPSSSSCSDTDDTEDSEMESDNVRSEMEDLNDSEDYELQYIPKPGYQEDESPSELTDRNASPYPETAVSQEKEEKRQKHNSSPRQALWKKTDIDPFQVPDPVFVALVIAHIVEETNIYSVQQDWICNQHKPWSDFMISCRLQYMLLYMGVFDFPTFVDYWHSDSRFPP
ncbi:unnamed protein product [Coregonus sp. 'balchen']|nr:unnamed protein product [Coregonus sp. 'balchen']